MKKNTTERPVRIAILSERYEVAASLFESVYTDTLRDASMQSALRHLSPEEEMLLGIFADEDDPDGEENFFVKPADPAVLNAMRTGSETDAIEKIEIYSEGVLTVTSDGSFSETPSQTVSISYDETELTGMEGATSTVTYRTADPGLVTMLRTGTVNTAMTFKAHHRAICTYDTPYMPLQVGIHALTVDNRLDTDGELTLDYIIEIRGARAERCTMTMKITAAED